MIDFRTVKRCEQTPPVMLVKQKNGTVDVCCGGVRVGYCKADGIVFTGDFGAVYHSEDLRAIADLLDQTERSKR